MRRSPNHPSAGAGQFALRFRLLMSYHDLTLRDIAEGTRCAVSTVGTWKNGRMPSSARVRERLAEIFHVSVEYLLEGRPAARASGGKDGVGPEALAGRVLEDLELLMRVLEAHAGPAEAVREIGREARGEKENEGNGGNGRRVKGGRVLGVGWTRSGSALGGWEAGG